MCNKMWNTLQLCLSVEKEKGNPSWPYKKRWGITCKGLGNIFGWSWPFDTKKGRKESWPGWGLRKRGRIEKGFHFSSLFWLSMVHKKTRFFLFYFGEGEEQRASSIEIVFFPLFRVAHLFFFLLSCFMLPHGHSYGHTLLIRKVDFVDDCIVSTPWKLSRMNMPSSCLC